MSTYRLGRAVIALLVGFAAILAPSTPAVAQAPERPSAPSPVPAPAGDPSPLSIWRVYLDGPEDAERLANAGFDLLEGVGDGYLYVLGENEVAVALRQDGFRVKRDRKLSPLPGIGRARIHDRHDSHDGGGRQGEMSIAEALDYYGGYRTV
ncbi:MAG: hypothetical protein OER95_08320, partial [Acidimicrobiia bacterium]|nr:hypothetical protein [Acidimicrobiia bacterium]